MTIEELKEDHRWFVKGYGVSLKYPCHGNIQYCIDCNQFKTTQENLDYCVQQMSDYLFYTRETLKPDLVDVSVYTSS